MRLTKLFVASLTVLTVALMVTAPMALACDKAKASTASTETASSCASKGAAASTASTKTASSCASKGAAASTASTKTASSCASQGAAASTASTKTASSCASKAAATTAGSSCIGGEAKTAKMDMAIETVRMPSGALAVMYKGNDADTVAYLHSAANGKAADFSCDLVKSMASTENCSVEMATYEGGVMFICVSDDAAVIDGFAKTYATVMSQDEEATDGE